MTRKIIAIMLLITCITAFPSLSCAEEKSRPAATALGSSLDKLKVEILSYFVAVSGGISSIDGPNVTIDKGSSSSIKTGMRINAFKEGATFIHPVTKEPLGKMEMAVGDVEIISADAASARAAIISGKPEDFQGAKIKIPARKIKVLFYQGNLDWYLGDAYYRLLLDSGRFELIDTGIQASNTAEIIAEAKKNGAEVALVLSSMELKDSVEVTQKLYWASDGRQFSDTKTSVHVASVKQLKFSAGAFAPREGEALLAYKLPFSARRIAVGDFSGDGNAKIVLAESDHVAIYKPDVDLKLLWEFKTPGSGEIIWLDPLDIDKDGRDELLITTISSSREFPGDDALIRRTPAASGTTVRSYIYKLDGGVFKLLWKAENVFIRKVENSIVSQEFSSAEGFEGKMHVMSYSNGRLVKGEELKMPKGINIFDFQYVYAPDGRRAFFAWDENGFLNFYNDKGIRTWVSSEGFGGFADSYKKESSNLMVDKGNWTMKDRLVGNNAEVLAPKRKAMLGFVNVKSFLGYAGSELRSFWWNGINIEERAFLEEMGGNILDYTVEGDRLMVLVKPYILSSAKLILKGQSPFGHMLYVFSTKGR